MKGKKGTALFKGSSVGMIILGILGVLMYGLMSVIMGVGVVAADYDKLEGAMVVVTFVIYTVLSAVSIVAGVYGIKKSDDPKAAKTCLVLGIIVLAFYCFIDVCSAINSEQQLTIVHDIYTIITHVIPSFYVWGAYYLTQDSPR